MRILNEQFISFSEKKYNEDTIGFTKSGVFIIDGASGLTKTNLTNTENDVYWYVSQWKEILEANLDSDRSLKDILKDGLNIIKRRFYSIIDKADIEPLNFPSAAIAILRLKNNNIEYFILGDCSIAFKSNNDSTYYLKDDRVTAFDKEVIKHIIKENENNEDQEKIFKGFSEKTLNMLRENRLKKNTDKGYWILEFDETAIDQGLCGSLNVKDFAQAVLMTDGFSSSIDNYEIIDENNILNYAKNNGLQDIYNKIRSIEKDDVDCRKYPRLMKSDDSSAIYIEIERE